MRARGRGAHRAGHAPRWASPGAHRVRRSHTLSTAPWRRYYGEGRAAYLLGEQGEVLGRVCYPYFGGLTGLTTSPPIAPTAVVANGELIPPLCLETRLAVRLLFA